MTTIPAAAGRAGRQEKGVTRPTMAGKKSASESSESEVYGARYTLRAGDDPAGIRALAADLRARMREIAEPSMGADPLKVAVLTALRLLDEVGSSRAGAASADATVVARI